MATNDALIEAKKLISEVQASRDEAEFEVNSATKAAELADQAAAGAEAKKQAATDALAAAEEQQQASIVAISKAKAEVAKAEADKEVAKELSRPPKLRWRRPTRLLPG